MSYNPILCVDDDPINLALLRNTLQENYKLIFASNGTEALTMAVSQLPSLILLDVQMPDITGFEVAQQLKLNPKTEHIPIIFVTSLLDEDDEQAGFDAGGVDYITKPISPCLVRARVRTHLSLVAASRLDTICQDAVYMLGEAGHYNDNDTGLHIWRMAAYSHSLALAVGWDNDAARLLQMAAPMHDTGKIGIPDAILRKPDKLNAEEWTIMKQHSRIGYTILSKSNEALFKLAAEIALNHHEKWDGSGYPNGLAGEAIPESARIVAIADVFDALSMRRPYKEPWPIERILPTLHEMAIGHFDKRLVGVFMDILPEILEIKAEWDSRSEVMSAIKSF
ncbi:MAG: HD domain-containing protein [Methylococcales bacterium]|nr:HD domain-containing protein [Methylococcales bacterium]